MTVESQPSEPGHELIELSASELVVLLRSGAISPLELLDALEHRIDAVNPIVNAIPTQCFERARKQARELMDRPVEERGILCGLPVAIKDLEPVEGVRSTWGSPIYSDFVPSGSDCMVEQIEKNGGIVYAKTNTPEFGAGANTFNDVFGKTLNPFDTTKSCAGSSGGSAVALATGMAWLATGSDLGGSLRNPASFCSVTGFRPSPGRIPQGPARDGAYPPDLGGIPDQVFGVVGPMARNVSDLALLLDAMSGHHHANFLSYPSPPDECRQALLRPARPLKIAYSKDFGITPVDPEVARITEAAARQFESLGHEVTLAHPDFSEVQDIFQINRAMSFYVSQKQLLQNKRELLKPEVIWNIEKAREVSMDDIERVDNARARYFKRANDFFQHYDLLLSPATIVPPYPIDDRYVASCEGVEFSNYIEWCTIAYAITITGFPAMSLPAGFTQTGLPVGLQMVTGPRSEAELLHAALQLEQLLGLKHHVPMMPVPASNWST